MKYKTILFFLVFSLIILYNPAFAQEAIEAGKSPQGKISLDIKGMDIIDVLKLLSKQAGLNIVAGKDVRGAVTLFLKDVDPRDAFEIILTANNLACEEKNGIITVMTERDYELLYGEKFNIRKNVKIVKLRYVKAANISSALNQIKTNVGLVVVDESSNSVIIRDAPEAMARMLNAINELDTQTVTKVYSLNYATAEKVKEKLTNTLSKSGIIEIDERTNKLIITDMPKKIEEIDTLVKALDEKTKQVLIEAKIIQIDLDDEYKFGVNWDKFFNGLEHLKIGANFQAITGAISPTTSNTTTGGIFRIGDLDKDSYQATIKALETLGKTNILSTPRIVTANNQEAKILVGTNQPYATSTTTTPSTGSSVRSYQITYLDLGVKLVVTPTINEDNFITMKIKPAVTSKTSDYEYGEYDDKVPVVKTSEAETIVMVKDGTTVIIAGLMEAREEEDINKVPILGDIPLIGNLFKSRTRGSASTPEKTELVIFITPHIVTGEVESEDKKAYEDFIYRMETFEESKEFFKKKSKQKEPVTDEKNDIAKDQRAIEVKETPPVESVDKETEVVTEEPLNASDEAIAYKAENVKFPEEYKELVKNSIHEMVNKHLTPALRGEVGVEFSILEDGTLNGEPRVTKSTNKELEKLIIVCVKKASPFPPFPSNLSVKEKTFKIFISY